MVLAVGLDSAIGEQTAPNSAQLSAREDPNPDSDNPANVNLESVNPANVNPANVNLGSAAQGAQPAVTDAVTDAVTESAVAETGMPRSTNKGFLGKMKV